MLAATVSCSVFCPFGEFPLGLCATLGLFCLLLLVCSCRFAGVLLGARFWSMLVVVGVFHVYNQDLECCSLFGEQLKRMAPSSRGIS